MGRAGLAATQKKTARLKAHLVFIDESGLLMAPLVHRTWALRDQTPHLHQRGRSHTKVSVTAALSIAPDRRRLQLLFRLHPDANLDGERVRSFLQQLRRQLVGPLVVVWDRLNAHRSQPIRALLTQTTDLHLAFLPLYAPELNPVEQVWGYLKGNPLANLAAADVEELADAARHHGRSLQRRQRLLQSFLAHSPLPLRLRRT